MNCKGIHGFVTAILIAVLLLSTPYDTSAGYEEGPDHVISSMAQNPIWIEGDTSFDEYAAYYGWNGNGSRGNPYIIKDHVIDSRGSDRGIGISGTDHYFRIENCTVHDVYGGSGIYISLAKGDIISCSLWNNTIGIHLTDCSDIKVHGNNLSNNDRGAHVHRSSNVS
ncbi:MAG: right-handed parallel beta-helix repeat-containing protein, partial [Candidatus Thermoplasmatota archaeon]|nr:right-handed parallel beta-helix repeat-containing protein [Candidatus Thermoplasmatota archaeon]